MKWSKPSHAATLLIEKSLECSRSRWGRRRKLSALLAEISHLKDPTAIPHLAPFLFDRDPEIARHSGKLIESLLKLLPTSLLPRLDGSIRNVSFFPMLDDRNVRSRTDANRVVDRLPDSTTALGIVSCHSNGFIRECAIEKLDDQSVSGDELPFFLLRLSDWVPSVRSAAEFAVERRLIPELREDFMKSLSLISSLTGRIRVRGSRLIGPIENLLKSDPISLMRASVSYIGSGTYRYGLKLALVESADGGDILSPESLGTIIQASHPAARQFITSWLVKPSTPEPLQNALLPKLLDDHYFAVRRIALGWCAFRDPNRFLPAVEHALMDENRVVRNLAQFHIRKLHTLDLASFYRERLLQASEISVRSALLGIGETGQSDDAHLILPFTDSDCLKTKKAALESLGKLDATSHLEVFVEALQSGSPSVSRLARFIMIPFAKRVGGSRFEQIWRSTLQEHVRLNIVKLVNHLSKWEKVPILLAIQAGSDPVASSLARNFLVNWFYTFNQFHQIKPSNSEVEALRLALEMYGGALPQRLQFELTTLVGPD